MDDISHFQMPYLVIWKYILCISNYFFNLYQDDWAIILFYFKYDLFGLFMAAEWEDKEEGKDTAQQWEDDWDDDDVNDDFSLHLKKELESNTEKS